MIIEDFIKYKIIKEIINPEILLFLNKNKDFISKFPKFTQAELKAIRNVLYYDLANIKSLENRFYEIKKLGRDSSSLISNIIRYGENEGKLRFDNKCKKSSCGSKKEDYILKYGKSIGLIKYKKDRTSIGLDTMIERYGDINGKIKWQNYLKKYKKSHSLDGYIEKYGKIKGEKLYQSKIERYKKTNSLSGYIEKYGTIKGTEVWNTLIEKRAAKLTKEYIKFFYGEKAKDILKKRFGHTSLKSFKKRFGEEEGNIRYNEFVERVRYTSSLAYLYDTYPKEIADKKREERRLKFLETHRINNSWNFANYSTISQDLFWLIYEELQEKENIKFFTLNKEFYIYDEMKKSVFAYDFKYKDKIIEFNGDYYHCNPELYHKEYYNKRKDMKAQEIWDFDKYKLEHAFNKGYQTLVIWEQDFIKDPEKTLKKCINFLNKL